MTTRRKVTLALSYLRSAYKDIRSIYPSKSQYLVIAINEIKYWISRLDIGKCYNISLKTK